jgi:hypothetical protein
VEGEINQFDQERYKLAVKIGIIGTILFVACLILFEIEYFLDISNPPENGFYLGPVATRQPYLSQLMWHPVVILGSVGFVGLFSLKGRNLGIVFPLLAIIYSFIDALLDHLWDLLSYHHYSLLSDIWHFSINVVALTGGVCLLLIRKNTASPVFFTAFAFLYMTRKFLADAIYFLFLERNLYWFSVSDYMLATYPSFIIGLIVGFLSIAVFVLELRTDFGKTSQSMVVGHVTKS